MKHLRWLTALVVGAFLLAACGGMQAAVPEGELVLASAPSYTENWDGRGSDSEKCRLLGEGDPRADVEGSGWVHWVFSTKGLSTGALLVVDGVEYTPGLPDDANVYHFYTPYRDPATIEASVTLFGVSLAPRGGGLVISDYCPGDEGLSLDVRKTAYTEFKREHKWDIAKKVETKYQFELEDGTPKIWLYTDGSGDEKATWTVDVTYKGAVDSAFVVYGTIEIENISASEADKIIESIADDLGFPGYGDIALDCGVGFALPYTIEFGEVVTCTYRVEFPDGVAEQGDLGTNAVTVHVEDDENVYGATADWEFDEPTTELKKTVNVSDISDLFGSVALGSVTAPNNRTFTYTKDFAWADYGQDGCGSNAYGNTAKIFETNQTANALLKVNVQCYLWESAWAKGAGTGVTAKPFCDNGFRNWGWTNQLSAYHVSQMPLYAGAGQCDVDKGTLVGQFFYTYAAGVFTYSFVPTAGSGILFAGEAVYADKGMFPLLPNRRPTTAPGAYYVKRPIPAPSIHVIAHVNAGIPDPNFGP